jgi:choline kinase
MQTTKFDYLVIVASGLGTRMQQYTLNNYLPKSLVSLGNETILDAQLKDAHELANKVVIICRNEHYWILKNRQITPSGPCQWRLCRSSRPLTGDRGRAW